MIAESLPTPEEEREARRLGEEKANNTSGRHEELISAEVERIKRVRENTKKNAEDRQPKES